MSPAHAIRSVCLVRLSALGDVVLVLPLIRALQAWSPGVRITWVIGRGAHALVSGLADEGIEFVVIDKRRGPRDYLAFRRRLAGRDFDALLCLQASWRANWLYPFIKARRKIGYSADRARDLQRLFVRERIDGAAPHLVDGFLQFAESLGMPRPGSAQWGLSVQKAAADWASTALPHGPFIALSPCASKAERDWPMERYCDLLRELHTRGLGPVVLLGGNSARERLAAASIAVGVPAPVTNLMGTTTLPQLVAALARCRLLISPDTGAVHIANALGRPVVGLYAVAPASRTGPYSHTEYCVDVFDEAVRTVLGKDPARVPWSQRVHDPRAMGLISVAAVLEKIQRITERDDVMARP